MAAPVSSGAQSQQQQLHPAAAAALESAGRLVDEHLLADAGQLELSAQLKIATHSRGLLAN